MARPRSKWDIVITTGFTLTHRITRFLNRLTLVGKLFLLLTIGFVFYYILGRVVSVKSIQFDQYEEFYPEDAESGGRPKMNYFNGTTESFEDTGQPTSTAFPSTTHIPATTPHHKRHKKKHKHHEHENKHEHDPRHRPEHDRVQFMEHEAKGVEPETRVPIQWEPGEKKNVLFIMADDLRAQTGSYFQSDSVTTGDPRKLYTPNIDRLAGESLVLKRAYCQYGLCGPSRTSMMTSRSPDVTKVYLNNVYWRESAGPFITLPQYFKDNGYKTMSIGKVFHVQDHKHNADPMSWSTQHYKPQHVRHIRHVGANWLAVDQKEREKDPLEDERLVAHARNVLHRIVAKSKGGKVDPFFMAVGFYRPHVPMICPEEFFNMYPLESGDKYMSDVHWQTPTYNQRQRLAPFEPGTTNNDHIRNIPDMAMRQMRRSYFACVSYVDHLIGILLDSLDEFGLRNSTIVSLVADHGYHLGENNLVSKYTNHEVGVRVPLMMRIPGATDRGINSRSLVELLDIFPTITAAAGLPIPPKCPERSTQTQLCTEGHNLLPMLNDPEYSVRDAAFSQIFRGRDLMEYSIRTDRIRYIDFAKYKRIQLGYNLLQLQLIWDINLAYSAHSRQLYDLARDPEERYNLYNYPEYANFRNHLRERLMEKFKVVHDYPVGLY